ncbi:MAG: FAD-binding protein [Lentisphaeria bacterium]|nr:FAD-binding protein [Lentisphaeria bacterium]
MEYDITEVHNLVIGSGAAGLAAAVRLAALNDGNTVIYTEGLAMGTSVNTGSD